ncbi:tryptophan--tRNA ligase [Candidatus Parcubacteria bacterium]|nr:tryptophan--tRNA ligase [Candidatus Parcubacteria bacterium]
MKKTLFSGIQPTGELHIGNYLGALKQWVEIQHQYNSIFSVVDYHSLTEDFDPKKKQEQILNTAVDFLSAGIDPKKSIIFVQSHVPEHTELAWILNCVTPVAELERMTQYKDKAERQKTNINMGLFDYPVLMAADILLYKTQVVPVGEDQQQHVELARKIAKKFNNKFGKIFPEPEARLTKTARVMSLSNPEKKMSKSLGEKTYIALSDTPKMIEKKIKSAVTTNEGALNLIDLLEEFSNDVKLVQKFKNEFKNKSIKYSALTPALAQAVIKTLRPIRERKEKLLKDKNYVAGVLADGAKKAGKIAEKNIREIKKLIGIL